jgi:hypothetical protein
MDQREIQRETSEIVNASLFFLYHSVIPLVPVLRLSVSRLCFKARYTIKMISLGKESGFNNSFTAVRSYIRPLIGLLQNHCFSHPMFIWPCLANEARRVAKILKYLMRKSLLVLFELNKKGFYRDSNKAPAVSVSCNVSAESPL